jgi:hypothetical protein
MPEWKQNEAGQVDLKSLVGWRTELIPMVGLLQIQYAESDEDLHTGGAVLQLAMTAEQAFLLAKDLMEMLDRLEQQPIGTKQ